MTTSNFNKIVRSNINIKPWILSKNTSEIINTYIQKIYKQPPKALKSDLLQSKIAVSKPENKGPLRSLKLRERTRTPNNTNAISRSRVHVSNANCEKLLTAVMLSSRKSNMWNFAANKKLLKSPNYKIYGSRRFGSSASSSNASIFRRFDERRRQRAPVVLDVHSNVRRAYSTQRNFGLRSAVARYLVPARNQHMESYEQLRPHALQVSSAIQRDLMVIDSAIKDRIALGRDRLVKLADARKSGDPMNGWHHPPSPELFMVRLDERGVANAELQEQHRRLKIASKQKHTAYLRQTDVAGSTSRRASRQRMSDAYQCIAQESLARVQPLAVRQMAPQRFRRTPLDSQPPQSSQSQIQAKIHAQARGKAQTQPAAPRFCLPSTISRPHQQQPQSQPQSQSQTQTAAETAAKVAPENAKSQPGSPFASATATSVMAAAAVANVSAAYSFSRFNRSSYNRLRRY